MKQHRSFHFFHIVILIFAFNFSSFAQGKWRLTGNSNLPAVDDVTAPGANIFGVNAPFLTPVNFQTNGLNRMIMNSGLGGGTAGRMAMGNNLSFWFYANCSSSLTSNTWPNGNDEIFTHNNRINRQRWL